MKIISAYKDYYDYLAHVYGVDHSVVYNRKPLTERRETSSGSYHPSSEIKFDWHAKIRPIGRVWSEYRTSNVAADIVAIVVGGRIFYLRRTFDMHSVHREVTSIKVWDGVEDEVWDDLHFRYMRRESEMQKLVMEHREVTPAGIELCKLIGQPVFLIERVNRYNSVMEIAGNIPKLHKYISGVLPADQCYQDIDYMLRNLIKHSPDTMPPSAITDKEKVVSHGFDSRISFRHRKDTV